MAFAKIRHCFLRKQKAISKLAHAWPIGIKRDNGIEGKLHQHGNGSRLIAQRHSGDDGQIAPRTVARCDEAIDL